MYKGVLAAWQAAFNADMSHQSALQQNGFFVRSLLCMCVDHCRRLSRCWDVALTWLHRAVLGGAINYFELLSKAGRNFSEAEARFFYAAHEGPLP